MDRHVQQTHGKAKSLVQNVLTYIAETLQKTDSLTCKKIKMQRTWSVSGSQVPETQCFTDHHQQPGIQYIFLEHYHCCCQQSQFTFRRLSGDFFAEITRKVALSTTTNRKYLVLFLNNSVDF